MTTHQIQLLLTSDIHGYIMPTAYRGVQEPFGLALLASTIELLRKERPTLLIDNGDLIQGSPLVYYSNAFQADKPNPIIAAANATGYDAAVLGNHEFNYGLQHLNKAIEQSQFPWLCCNIVHEDGSPWVQPYHIFEVDGIRIGVLGVTTHFITQWERPEHIAGLTINDALEAARYWLEVMKQEEVHISVISYHGGFSHSLETGEAEEAISGENQGYQMLAELDFDILLTGHQHRELAASAHGKSIVQPGYRGAYLGKIEITVELEQGKCISKQHKPQLIAANPELTPMQGVVDAVSAMHETTEQWLDQTLAVVSDNMFYEDAFEVRVHKHAYIQFLQELQMYATGASISCASLLHDLPGGFKPTITMRDIVTNYIYPNTLKVLAVTGEQMLMALEQSASYFELVDGKLTVSPAFQHPKSQGYNYDMWEGIDYVIDPAKPVGQRIVKAAYRGQPIDPSQVYEVVMNSYRATGAGNFPYFATCPVLQDQQIDMTELIANYLRKHPVIHASCKPNWKVV